jgi:lipopolysaccharide/colanic/teichoic acid biosynthesis glycosyltransferase
MPSYRDTASGQVVSLPELIEWPQNPGYFSPAALSYAPGKVGFDYFLALVMVIPVTAVALALALLTRLTSRGPGFYWQTRVGKGGRPYTLRKVRTMVQDSETRTGPQWSTPGDPRVTRLGRILRRTHLDELPQLWNVLCGEMSLIGPRPERPEFVPALAKAIPRYRDRLRVRPGVTGLAQVQLPADENLDSVRKKVAYDLWYVRNHTFWLDCRILAATALKLGGVSFPTLRWLLRFPSQDTVDQAYRALCAGDLSRPQRVPQAEEAGRPLLPAAGPLLLNAERAGA